MKRFLILSWVLLTLLPLNACLFDEQAPLFVNTTFRKKEKRPLTIGVLPDLDSERSPRVYPKLTEYLRKRLNIPVVHKPITNETVAISAFKVGDLDLVWFGGLSGVQARLQRPGAEAIAQRDTDAQFRSVFIANTATGLASFWSLKDLAQLKGRTFTFGSELSIPGRLMPQYYLQQAGVKLSDFKGEPGFSQSDDATLELVESGIYEVGVINQQIWKRRLAEGRVDQSRVQVLWQTPTYFDYHWVVNPTIRDRFGSGIVQQIQTALVELNPNKPAEKEILDLFNARKFISTKAANYSQIEQIGREIGKIR